MKTSVLIISFSLVLGVCTAKNHTLVDSLENLLPSQYGTERIETLSELCWQNLYSHPEKSGNYAKLSINEARKLKDIDSILAAAYNDLGTYYLIVGTYDSALLYLDTSITIRTRINDKRGVAGVRNKTALIYHWRGQYEKAIIEQEYVIEFFEQSGDTLNLANAYNNLGELHYELGNYSKAVEIHSMNLKNRILANDSIGFAATLHNLGNSLVNLGDTVRGLEYIDSSLILFQKYKRQEMIAMVYHNTGTIFYRKGDIKEGEIRLIKAVETLRTLDYKRDLASSLSTLGEIYRIQKRRNLALNTLHEALDLAKEIGSYIIKAQAYQNLSKLYADKYMWDSAYHYSTLLIISNDTVYKQESNDALHKYQTKFETEKKEQENQRLAKENELKELKLASAKRNKRNLILIFNISALLALVLFASWFSRMRLKNKAALENEMANQKNLRFKAIIEAEEKERIRIAKDLHDGIGQLLSTARVNIASLEGEVEKEDEIIVENSLNVIDESIREIRTVSHNMMPVALIDFGLIKAIETMVSRINEANSIEVLFKHKGIESRIEQSAEISLYRIIQEVINNMLKHSQAEKIIIELLKKNEQIMLKIQDNGKGFNVDDIEQSTGIGWKNIYSRLLMINGNIDIKSNPGMGTVININFNI